MKKLFLTSTVMLVTGCGPLATIRPDGVVERHYCGYVLGLQPWFDRPKLQHYKDMDKQQDHAAVKSELDALTAEFFHAVSFVAGQTPPYQNIHALFIEPGLQT